LQVKLGPYILALGRRKNEPKRVTTDNYNSMTPFLSITKQKQSFPKPNSQQLRYFSMNTIVRMVINLIADSVMKKKWELVDKSDSPDNSDNNPQIKIVKNIINNPNNDDDYDSFFRAILEDSLVGDCMCFEKGLSGNPARPIYLWPVDGMTIDLVVGSGQFKYAQIGKDDRQYYTTDQLAYIKRVNRTDTPFGLSPLETAFLYVSALTRAFQYSADVRSDALPKYVLNLGKDFVGTKLPEFRDYFINDCMGTVSVPIVATDKIESAQIAPVSEEATFMGYQQFLMAIIAYSFGVPADLIGVSKSNDRSTLLEKLGLMGEIGVKPYLKLIEKAVNKHIIDNLGYNLEFHFVQEETLEEKQKKATLVTSVVASDLLTIDEGRIQLGQEPLNNEFSDQTITVYKAMVNEKYGINGFGTAKDTTPKQ